MKSTCIIALLTIVPGGLAAWLGDCFNSHMALVLGIWWFASFFVAWPLCVFISKVKARVRNHRRP